MRRFSLAVFIICALFVAAAPHGFAQGMAAEQAQEKIELENMGKEMKNITGTIDDAIGALDEAKKKIDSANFADVTEVHLIAKEGSCEMPSGTSIPTLMYNGKIPGPTVMLLEGQAARIVLHNNMKQATSLHFHGMILPQKVDGLPRREGGLVKAGESYAYQFVAGKPGTYWYHPQVVHADQKARGLYGLIVVRAKAPNGAPDRELGFVLSELTSGGTTYYLVNGKCAPDIPPIELKRGERVHMRIVNAGAKSVPLHLSGHRMEICATNGSDNLEPHVFRDTITVNPGDRLDVEFLADNPGVWSLASELPEQTETNGKFPGGIACVVRYPDALKQ